MKRTNKICLLNVKHAFVLLKQFSFCVCAVYKTEINMLFFIIYDVRNFSLRYFEKESCWVKERWTTDKSWDNYCAANDSCSIVKLLRIKRRIIRVTSDRENFIFLLYLKRQILTTNENDDLINILGRIYTTNVSYLLQQL